MRYLEVMADYAAYLGSKDEKKSDPELEALVKHESMEAFSECSDANKVT